MQLNSNNKDQQDDYCEGQQIHGKALKFPLSSPSKLPTESPRTSIKLLQQLEKKKISNKDVCLCAMDKI